MALENNQALSLLKLVGETNSLATLDHLSRSIWEDLRAGRISDAQAQSLAECIESRRHKIRGVDIVAIRAPSVAAEGRARGFSHFPPRRKVPRPASCQASLERRRILAFSGPMPLALASQFTTGELAALRIVADEVRDKKQCSRTLGEIASRAGVCLTTARNALRQAALLGLLTIQERRRDRQPNLANIIRIVSREWTVWIERGAGKKAPAPPKGGGCKKHESTDKGLYKTLYRDRSLSDQHIPFKPVTPVLRQAAGSRIRA